jgi:hypothetical protein
VCRRYELVFLKNSFEYRECLIHGRLIQWYAPTNILPVERPHGKQLVQKDEEAIFLLARLPEEHDSWFLNGAVERLFAP